MGILPWDFFLSFLSPSLKPGKKLDGLWSSGPGREGVSRGSGETQLDCQLQDEGGQV